MSLPPIIQPASPRGQDPLPQPDNEAQAHSQALCEKILAAIEAAGGWMPFTQFMGLALYAPALGYYSGGAHKFGAAGDFVTGPEMTPLFGRTLARTIAPMLAASKPYLTEAGAGTGKLAGDLLQALEAMGQLPERYDILELSAELAQRQRAHLAATVPHLIDRIHWLSALPETIEGVLVGNEVLDAMPVELVRWKDGQGQRLGVSVERIDDGIRFITTPGETSTELATLIAKVIPFIPGKSTGHPAKRVFQALRIEVNGELEVLERTMPAALDALAVGGRIVVMSYHSLEDRITKQAFSAAANSSAPIELPMELPEHAPTIRLIVKGAEPASAEEIARNPRAASVRLRAAEKIRSKA